MEAHFDTNNLTRLPSTVRKLPRLTVLTVDANRIGTLALIPSLARLKKGAGSAQASLLWERRELGDGRIVFINRFTGEMSEIDPSKEADKSASAPSNEEQNDSKRHAEQKSPPQTKKPPTLVSLALADKTVWELKFDFRTGTSYYFNNLTFQRRPDAPPAIDTLGKTVNLRRLVITSNVLMHLPRSLGKLPSLEELVLDHNLIGEVPPQIQGLTKLTLLSIADNRLTSLPDEITMLPRLRKLRVNRNRITKLPLWIGRLTTLKSLWLNNNCLDELPWTMGRLEGLKELVIGDNPVEMKWKGVLEGPGKIPAMLQVSNDN